MGKSIKVNFLYNLIHSLSSLLFPLIAFPYAARIILADGIGIVSFYQSIVQYISLLTSIGIPLYGIRMVARIRDNIYELRRVTAELLILNMLLVAFGYLLVLIFTQTIPQIQVNIPLFLLLSLTIFFNAIGCEWFFQGIEEFKYITIRGLIVKTLSLVLLFVFVKTKEDIMWYAAYTVFGVLGGNLFNFIRLRKYISISEIVIRTLHPFRHLKPALHIFVLNLIVSIYVYLNTAMLGFLSDTTSVGLYTAASKLSHVLLTLVSALGTVMLARLSNLADTNQQDKFIILSRKAITFVLAITIPISVGMILTAPFLIELFCGKEFIEATQALRVLSPLLLVIGLSNVLGIQILYPQGQENKVILCTGIGAVSNFFLNLFMIPKYGYNGAAVATLVAEVLVTCSMMFFGRKYIQYNWKSKSILNYLLGASLMAIVVIIVQKSIDASTMISLLACTLSGLFVYAGSLFLCKDELMSEALIIIKRHFLKNNEI